MVRHLKYNVIPFEQLLSWCIQLGVVVVNDRGLVTVFSYQSARLFQFRLLYRLYSL
jgi:hypothetical protein